MIVIIIIAVAGLLIYFETKKTNRLLLITEQTQIRQHQVSRQIQLDRNFNLKYQTYRSPTELTQ